jgi:hypothetical protein
MQIIFDEKLVPELKERYIVLELDTVLQPEMKSPITLYALIPDIDISTISTIKDLCDQHQLLVDAYKTGDWDTAEFNANALKGSWQGEIDEFYDLVLETAQKYRNSQDKWTGIRYTTPTE